MSPVRVVVSWMAFDPGGDPAPAVAAALPEAERARAARMPSRLRAREFIAGRWLLRHALSERLGARAWSCTLAPGGASPDPCVAWSLAHEGGLAAVAVADGAAVGIDLMRAFPVDAAARGIGAALERSVPAVDAGDDPSLRWMCAEAGVKLAGGWRAAGGRRTGAAADEPIIRTILRGPFGVRAAIATRRPAAVAQRRVAYP